MGIVMVALFFVTVVWFLCQLRLRGCAFWLVWMVVGAGAVLVVRAFLAGILRV